MEGKTQTSDKRYWHAWGGGRVYNGHRGQESHFSLRRRPLSILFAVPSSTCVDVERETRLAAALEVRLSTFLRLHSDLLVSPMTSSVLVCVSPNPPPTCHHPPTTTHKSLANYLSLSRHLFTCLFPHTSGITYYTHKSLFVTCGYKLV